MNEYLSQYKEIYTNIVNKSFPQLKKKRVYIFESRLFNLKGMALRPLPNINLILLNKDVRDKDIDYKIGLLVHEISHIDLYNKQKWFRYLYEGFLYLISRKFRSINECKTEMHAIKKGYVKEVYHYSKDREDFRSKYGYLSSDSVMDFGLSLEEDVLES